MKTAFLVLALFCVLSFSCGLWDDDSVVVYEMVMLDNRSQEELIETYLASTFHGFPHQLDFPYKIQLNSL